MDQEEGNKGVSIWLESNSRLCSTGFWLGNLVPEQKKKNPGRFLADLMSITKYNNPAV